MNIRAGRVDDAAAVASLHGQRIADGFLVTLGARFLERLYRRTVTSPAAFLLVAQDAEGVSGFVAVAEHTARFYREFIRRDGLPALVASAPALLRAPTRVWETLRYGSSGPDDLPAAEVLAIGVAARAEGRGVGGELLAAALDELRRRGVDAARVVTAVDNHAALRMYARAGFVRNRRVEVHAGVAQEVLVWP